MKSILVFVALGTLLGLGIFWLRQPAETNAPRFAEASSKPFARKAPPQSTARVASAAPTAQSATAEETPAESPSVEVKSKSDEANTAIDQSWKLLADGKAEEAIGALTKTLERHPGDSAVLTHLAALHMEGFEETDIAAGYLVQAIEADPNNGDALSGLVQSYSESGRFAEAEALLKRLPASSQATVALGDLYLRQGRVDDAIEIFESTENEKERSAPGLQARAYDLAGRHEEAQAIWAQEEERARERFARSGSRADGRVYDNAQLDAAYSLLSNGKSAEARAKIEEVLQRNPNDRNALSLLEQVERGPRLGE